MPGTQVSTAVRSGPTAADASPSSTFIVPGLAERGSVTEAVEAHSMPEYEAEFGGRVTYGHMWDAVKMYFEEGGNRVIAVRVVGSNATSGGRTLVDRAASPLPTLQIDARGPGAWSSGVQVAILAGTIVGTFKVRVTFAGDIENYDNLVTPADAAAVITQRSKWITASDVGSATAAPNNIPALLAATALSAGTDDRGALVAADYVTALDERAGYELGAGAVAVPGQPSSAVGALLAAHAAANNRIVLAAPALGTVMADAIDAAQDLKLLDGADGIGFFYPWVQVPDGTNVVGATRLIPPEGYVAGVRARTQATEGPWAAPAGLAAQARYVVGVETEFTKAEGDQLDDSEVNVIRVIAKTVRLYGWRSCSADEVDFYLLSSRDFLNHLTVEGEKVLEQFVFKTIDPRGHLLSDVKNELKGLLEPMRVRGGLYELFAANGDRIDPGYSVDVGPTINPVSQLAQNTLAAEMGVRFSPTAAIVKFLITKAGLTAGL